MYLRVNITNNPVNMLIDTGSPFSIITKELAEILGVEIQHTDVDLSSPDGREITVYGKADVDLDNWSRISRSKFRQSKPLGDRFFRKDEC